MHRVFVTEGLVLGKRTVGESNTLVTLFTRELGLVRASARSSRKEVSKLRFGLEPLCVGYFSLVRGRSEWKLIGVERISYRRIPMSVERRMQTGRVVRLLERLVHGEESMQDLYATTIQGLAYLAAMDISAGTEGVEGILVLRILHELGYVADTSELMVFLGDTSFTEDTIAHAKALRPLLVRTINESLDVTGL